MTDTKTLSDSVKRFKKLEEAYNKAGLPMNEYSNIAADMAEVAPVIIYALFEMLKESQDIILDIMARLEGEKGDKPNA